jgi:hypothetical protein
VATNNSDITDLRAFLGWMIEKEILDPKKPQALRNLKTEPIIGNLQVLHST